MAACRNPECVRGLTPGIVVVGKGNAKTPILGASYRWGWVRCMACNRDPEKDKAVAYKHVQRSPEEIQQRRELANAKAAYKPEQQTTSSVGSALGKVAGSAQPSRTNGAAPIVDNSQLTRLLEANSKLTEQIAKLSGQVSDLLQENRDLRKALDVYSASHARETSTALVPAASAPSPT